MFKALIAAVSLAVAGIAVSAQEDVNKAQDAELVAFFNGLYNKTPLDCPERMVVNRLGETGYVMSVKILKGEIPATDDKKAAARKDLAKRREQIMLGQAWTLKQREEVKIPYAKARPELDGNMDSPEWRQGLVFNNEFNLDSLEEIKSGIEWRLLWDEENLYVGVKATDPSIKAIEYNTVPGKGPWDADCIEMFIMPSMRLKTYWEVVVNPEGKVFDGLHCNNKTGWFISRPEEDMAGLRTKAKIFDGGYVVQAALPFKELPNYMLGNKPEAGQTIYFSLIRTEDGQRRSPRPLLYDGHNIFGFLKATLEK
jgi:hypothetical protein